MLVLTGASFPLSLRRALLIPGFSSGVNGRADYEKEGAVAVPTFVVQSLGDFAVLA